MVRDGIRVKELKDIIMSVILACILSIGMIPSIAFAGEGAETKSGETLDVRSGSDSGYFDACEEGSDSAAPESHQEDVSLVAYVYLDLSSVPLGSMQNIVIGLVDEGLIADEAELVLAGGSSGETASVTLTRSVEGALLFEIPSSSLAIGNYSVQSLSYSTDEDDIYIDFAKENQDYSFEVVDGGGEESAEDSNGSTTAYIVDEKKYLGRGWKC